MKAMRRAFAVLLLALFSFPLIAPALSTSDRQSTLPACCRRDGKHHCEMMAMQLDEATPSLKSAPCTLFPRSAMGPADLGTGLAPSRPLRGVTLIRSRAPLLRAILPRAAGQHRAWPKRGPPSFEA